MSTPAWVKDIIEAIERAVYHAFLDLMDGAGSYPVTREDIITAISKGVENATFQAAP